MTKNSSILECRTFANQAAAESWVRTVRAVMRRGQTLDVERNGDGTVTVTWTQRYNA